MYRPAATRHRFQREPHLIGVASSGRLSLEYCRWRFARLAPFRAYELMCHPAVRPAGGSDPRLSNYHDWEGELATLTSPAFAALLGTVAAALHLRT